MVGLLRAPIPDSLPERVAQSRRRPFEYRACELTDAREVQSAIAAAAPDVIVHTASMTEVDACERNPEQAFASNVDATVHVSRAAREIRAHLVHVSTDYLFDGDDGPYVEEDVPNPRGVYATTKHIAEQAVRVLAPSWTIARTAVVYGWPPSGRPNFGSWLIGALRKGESVRLFEDQLVSPSLAQSVADMLAELAERRLTGIWNTCGASIVDRLTFGRELCGIFGFDPALCIPSKLSEAKLASPRPQRCGLRTDKAAAQLETKPLALPEALVGLHHEYLGTR